MKLTVRHRFPFGRMLPAGLDTPEGWDALREGDDSFAMPASRTDWEATAAKWDLEPRAHAVADVARHLGAHRICSYGAGAGYLEWHLRRIAPELELELTDFAPLTVARLRDHFEGVHVVHHELRTDAPRDADLHLLYRVDTELTDEEWRSVFAHFRQPVLVAATELLDLRAVAREIATRVLHPRAQAAGWIRTNDAFRALWEESHDDRPVELAGLSGFVLTPRSP